VVDIKKRREASLPQRSAENKQLAAYQLGLLADGLAPLPTGAESDGAGLLFSQNDEKESDAGSNSY
jgi:hypothetical protein